MWKAWLQQLHEGAAWYSVPEAQRTVWQRLATRTQGLATLGNAATTVGLGLCLSGLWFFYKGQLGMGSLLLVVGRLCDVLDGWLARRTKTQSPFGEGLDAGFDKVIILVASIVFIVKDVVPLVVVLFLVAEQVATATVSLLAHRHNIPLHPSRIGKLATFGIWVMIIIYFVAYDIQHKAQFGSQTILADGHTGTVLYKLATVFAAIIIVVSLVSLGRYIVTVRRQNSTKQKQLQNSLHR